MQVGNGLAAIAPIVDDESITGFFETKGGCDLRRAQKKVTEQGSIVRSGEGDSGDGFLWNNERVNGCLGIDIMKREDEFIFVDDTGRNLAGDYLLENGFTHVP